MAHNSFGDVIMSEFAGKDNSKYLKETIKRSVNPLAEYYIDNLFESLHDGFINAQDYRCVDFIDENLCREVKSLNRRFISYVFQHLRDQKYLKEQKPLYYSITDNLPVAVTQGKFKCSDNSYRSKHQDALDLMYSQNRRLESYRDDPRGEYGKDDRLLGNYNVLGCGNADNFYGNPDEERVDHVDRLHAESVPKSLNSEKLYIGKPGFGREDAESYLAVLSKNPFRDNNAIPYREQAIHHRHYDMDADEALSGFEFENLDRKSFDMERYKKRYSEANDFGY